MISLYFFNKRKKKALTRQRIVIRNDKKLTNLIYCVYLEYIAVSLGKSRYHYWTQTSLDSYTKLMQRLENGCKQFLDN